VSSELAWFLTSKFNRAAANCKSKFTTVKGSERARCAACIVQFVSAMKGPNDNMKLSNDNMVWSGR
jgi:hypothetical protein